MSLSSIDSTSSESSSTPISTISLSGLKKAKEEDSKKNWVKIGAIVAAVIGALLAGFGVLCTMGIFPNTLLGGLLGASITIAVGALIALPAAYVAYKNWSS